MRVTSSSSSFPAPGASHELRPGAEAKRRFLLTLMLRSSLVCHSVTSRESLELSSQTLPSLAATTTTIQHGKSLNEGHGEPCHPLTLTPP
jgi:hypothetical protein